MSVDPVQVALRVKDHSFKSDLSHLAIGLFFCAIFLTTRWISVD